MALWGNSENLGAIGPGSVTVVGTASSDFWTVNTDVVPTGTTILLDNGDAGFVVVEAVIAAGLSRVSKMSGVGTDVNQAFTATYCEQPIFLKNDPGYAPSSADGSLGRTQKPVGISSVEVAAQSGTIWETGVGWVGVTTYMDNSGAAPVLRVKKEILVASSSVDPTSTVRPYPGAFGG